jgi:hypothetical protein
VNGTLWIVLAGATAVVAGYLLVMRVLYRQSRDVDRQIDFAKIRPLKDDDRDN